jgi:hypothetical protein
MDGANGGAANDEKNMAIKTASKSWMKGRTAEIADRRAQGATQALIFSWAEWVYPEGGGDDVLMNAERVFYFGPKTVLDDAKVASLRIEKKIHAVATVTRATL